MSSKKPGLVKLLSKTLGIITNDPLHFLKLSSLFLFPISFLNTLSPFLFPLPSIHYTQFLPTVPSPYSDKTEIPPALKPAHLQIQLLLTLILLFFNTCAISSITRSTINALHHHPLHLATSLKSIPVSFLPILGTKLVAVLIMVLSSVALALFMGLIFVAFSLMFNTDYFSSTYYMVAVFIITAAVMIYVSLHWFLAYPIVVSESTWGYAPLRRSAYLVKGMRTVVLLMIMLFGIPSLAASIWYMNLVSKYAGGCTGWFIVEVVVYGGFVTVVPLFSIVANTVVLVYCKELHDEYLPVSKIDEYVKVPIVDHEGLMLSTIYPLN